MHRPKRKTQEPARYSEDGWIESKEISATTGNLKKKPTTRKKTPPTNDTQTERAEIDVESSSPTSSTQSPPAAHSLSRPARSPASPQPPIIRVYRQGQPGSRSFPFDKEAPAMLFWRQVIGVCEIPVADVYEVHITNPFMASRNLSITEHLNASREVLEERYQSLVKELGNDPSSHLDGAGCVVDVMVFTKSGLH